jgi:hypothetical protein
MAMGEELPFAVGPVVEVESVFADPVFDLVSGGIGRGPRDADGGDGAWGLEVFDYPLGVEGVAFAGEFAGQIGIAFPVREVRAFDGTIPAGGESAMGKRVGEDVTDGIFEISAAGEVSAVVGGIAPGAIVVPVPGSHAELGVVAVRERTPSGGESFLNDVRSVDVVDGGAGEDVDGAAEGLVGVEGVEDVAGIGVDVEGGDGGLRGRLGESGGGEKGE